MTFSAIDPVDPIVQRLRILVQDAPELKDAAVFYEAILPLLRDADLHVGAVSITSDQARAKMEKGLPLLHDIDLEFDEQAVSGLMLQLVRSIETAGEQESAHRVRIALEKGALDVGGLVLHMADGERALVASAAAGLCLDPGLVCTLTQNALKPALHAWCGQLTPIAEGMPWERGQCFICGAGAALGELQENNLVKHLRCGQCGADWVFPRLQCMYCGNEDHNTLGYLYTEKQREKMRVEVCNKCNGYLKVISSFAPTPPEMLAIEDLATVHLDYIAQEKGYERAVFLLSEITLACGT
jgi:FdhE protein